VTFALIKRQGQRGQGVLPEVTSRMNGIVRSLGQKPTKSIPEGFLEDRSRSTRGMPLKNLKLVCLVVPAMVTLARNWLCKG